MLLELEDELAGRVRQIAKGACGKLFALVSPGVAATTRRSRWESTLPSVEPFKLVTQNILYTLSLLISYTHTHTQVPVQNAEQSPSL